MVVQIYGNPMSAPYRITVMTAEALGVDYERRILGLGDHKSEWFLKVSTEQLKNTTPRQLLNVESLC